MKMAWTKKTILVFLGMTTQTGKKTDNVIKHNNNIYFLLMGLSVHFREILPINYLTMA